MPPARHGPTIDAVASHTPKDITMQNQALLADWIGGHDPIGDFIEMLEIFNIPFTMDDDMEVFKIKDLTFYLTGGRIVRHGYGLLPERGIDALLALLGRSRDELPPEPTFNPGPWGPFGPPTNT